MKGGLGAWFYSARQRMARAYRGLFSTAAQGFTIIEVLIVLAVTGGLFVGAAALISGKQNQTAFAQAIREIQSQIQQVVNEVSIGYYPNLGNFRCVASASGPSMSAASGQEQGSNSDCIFMAKVIQFKVASTDPEQFKVYTMAGLRLDPSTGQEVTTNAAASPKAVAPSTSAPGVPDDSTTDTLQNGLTTQTMVFGPGSGTNTAAVGFALSLASITSGALQSGAGRVDVIAINNTNLGMTPEEATEAINANYATSTVNPTNGVRICFQSGGTNQSGLITIGATNSDARQLSVKLDIKSNTTCS